MLEKTYKVEFFDANGTFLGDKRVRHGKTAQAPAAPQPPRGWRFDHWEPQVAFVLSDVQTMAVYSPKEYLVTFLSETGVVLKQEYVAHGHNATPPYYYSKLKGKSACWNGSIRNIQRSCVFCAVFEEQIA
ncbi:MAG: hypothetical protein FWH26_00745 [Oscillospiraceae bacterium]|nr:hypothetical protein [Oscillospiraceae bacterium]